MFASYGLFLEFFKYVDGKDCFLNTCLHALMCCLTFIGSSGDKHLNYVLLNVHIRWHHSSFDTQLRCEQNANGKLKWE